MTIGILALQGAFIEHQHILDSLEVKTILVRNTKDLDNIDGIILPGGESTAMGKLLRDFCMLEPLKKKIQNGLPVFGTCSGMILLAQKISQSDVVHLGVSNIQVKRNAYGRQLGSFETMGEFKGIDRKVKMTFIRAPYVEEVLENENSKEVEILSIVGEHITAIREKNILAVAFHPELTDDTAIHSYFLDMVKNTKSNSSFDKSK